MDDKTRDPDTGAEGGDSKDKDLPPAAPNPDADRPLGDSDQHSEVPTPPAERIPDRP